MFRGDGSRAQKLENRWNCLNGFVRGCSSTEEVVGGGIFDVFKTMVKPLMKTAFKAVGKTAKEGTKTLAKKAFDTAASETGSYVGKKR